MGFSPYFPNANTVIKRGDCVKSEPHHKVL